MIRPWLSDTIAALRRALRSAGIESSGISTVLLVGGTSRIPLVAQMVSEDLGRPVAVDAHPKHAVALGAALTAASTAGQGAVTPPVEPAVVPPPPPMAPSPSPDAPVVALQAGSSAPARSRRGLLVAAVVALVVVIGAAVVLT